ncbi:hypothetical protein D3C75_1185030 [compost metagenome]
MYVRGNAALAGVALLPADAVNAPLDVTVELLEAPAVDDISVFALSLLPQPDTIPKAKAAVTKTANILFIPIPPLAYILFVLIRVTYDNDSQYQYKCILARGFSRLNG